MSFLPPQMNKGQGIVWLACLSVLFSACAHRPMPAPSIPKVEKKELARMGYTVQVGAFSKVENAARLTESLRNQGIEATYFVAEKGLFKVRFGNFPSRVAALARAEALKGAGAFGDFYIVSPGEYTAARKELGSAFLREELVKTARSFLGVPYLWGGARGDRGFDCSGLTMTVYQLNGLDLPRTSEEQAEAGGPVARADLEKGDLVFFRATDSDKVSHVGIYAGEGRFIHAPGRGKQIRIDPLSHKYYQKHFAGGRSYL